MELQQFISNNYDLAIEKVVKFWTNIVTRSEVKIDSGDYPQDLITKKVFFEPNRELPTPETLKKFQDAIRFIMQREKNKVLSKGFQVVFYNDYDPKEFLLEAINLSGIDIFCFPIKTIVWIDIESEILEPDRLVVKAQEGYNGKLQVLFDIPR